MKYAKSVGKTSKIWFETRTRVCTHENVSFCDRSILMNTWLENYENMFHLMDGINAILIIIIALDEWRFSHIPLLKHWMYGNLILTWSAHATISSFAH